MSFGSDVKSEICSHRLNKRCCRRAEAYGMTMGIRTKKNGCITFKCANKDVATLAMHLFEKCFCPCRLTQSKNGIYSVESFDPIDISIYKHTEIDKDCCLTAYIRGAFLACGQLSNPGSTYRLDFNLLNPKDAEYLHKLLKDAGFAPMLSLKSNGKATVYFKNSGNVEDLMTYMGAPLSTLDLMEIRVEKDYKNHINRTVNFETANYLRSYNLGEQQIAIINHLRSIGAFETLPKQVKEIALIRSDNPDASLSELASIAGISKSSVNRRLQFLLEFKDSVKGNL